MSPLLAAEHDVDLWWSSVPEIGGTSAATRGSSVESRRSQAWAVCASVVRSYEPRGRVARVPGARPAVSGTEFEVSLTYAGSIVAIAVSRRRPIGIDAESLDVRIDGALARHALTVRELEALERLHPSRRREAFLRAWVRKEAVLKAAGVGLQVEPSSVETGIGRLSAASVVVPGAGSFRLVDLVLPGFACALAAGGTAPAHVRWHRAARPTDGAS